MSKLGFRSTVNQAAISVSGHLPPLTASSPYSRRTMTDRIAAPRNRRNTPTTGKARILAARNAQITVCSSLMDVSIEMRSLFWKRGRVDGFALDDWPQAERRCLDRISIRQSRSLNRLWLRSDLQQQLEISC